MGDDGFLDEEEVLRRILYLRRFVVPGDSRWAPVVARILELFEPHTAWGLVSVLFSPSDSDSALRRAARRGDMTTLAQALVAVSYDALPTFGTRWAELSDVDDVMSVLGEAVRIGVPPLMIDWHHDHSPVLEAAEAAVHSAQDVLRRVESAAVSISSHSEELKAAAVYAAEVAEANAHFSGTSATSAEYAAWVAEVAGGRSATAAASAAASASSAHAAAIDARGRSDASRVAAASASSAHAAASAASSRSASAAARARSAAERAHSDTEQAVKARQLATEAASMARAEARRIDEVARKLEKAQDNVRRDVIRLEGKVKTFEEKLDLILARVSQPRETIGIDAMTPTSRRPGRTQLRSTAPRDDSRAARSNSNSSAGRGQVKAVRRRHVEEHRGSDESDEVSSETDEALDTLADRIKRLSEHAEKTYDAFHPPKGMPGVRDRAFFVQGEGSLSLWRRAGVGADRLVESLFEQGFHQHVVLKLPQAERPHAKKLLGCIVAAIRDRPSPALERQLSEQVRRITDIAAYDTRTASIIDQLYAQDLIPEQHRRKVQLASRLLQRRKDADHDYDVALMRMESAPKNDTGVDAITDSAGVRGKRHSQPRPKVSPKPVVKQS